MMEPVEILFVDDEWCRPERQTLITGRYGDLCDGDPRYILRFETAADGKGGYSVEPVLAGLRSNARIGAVVLDMMFGERADRFGLTILAMIREAFPVLPVFIMTSLHVNEDFSAVERAMELGANEYLHKAPTQGDLRKLLATYVQMDSREARYAIWGNSQPVRTLRREIARVSRDGSVSVLICGERGTGKELVARAIHRQGPRRGGPFVAKNCAHDQSGLLESDLFGHERGAFTSAVTERAGLVERADGGVLFLDEIGGISQATQGRLLRVLQEREYERVGGTETLTTDFQLICATNEDPDVLVSAGKLRADFRDRVATFRMDVPPLRERREDIPILADLFLGRYRAGGGQNYPGERFAPQAYQVLERAQWEGNVRELENEVIAAVIRSRNREIDVETLRTSPTGGISGPSTVPMLAADYEMWPRQRLLLELRLAVAARRECKSSAEFVRRLYPLQTKQSTAGIRALVRRLTKGPWGDPKLREDPEARPLLEELED